MAHTTYTTDAFILGGNAVGEANRYISLVTRDLGFVRAVARSVRHERSKLRYSLQDYTFSTVSLVRGRDVWRLTGATDAWNPVLASGDARTHAVFARISSLLKRLLHGEEPNPDLFAVLQGLAEFAGRGAAAPATLDNAEVVTVMRVLYHLGYLAPATGMQSFIDSTAISDETIAVIEPLRRDVVAMINESLAESQL